MMAPDQVSRYRAAVAADGSGAELERVIAGIAARKVTVHGRDRLKTVPRGYDRDHPRAELLKNKGIVAWQEWAPAAWLGTPAARERVAGFLRAAAPLMSWLDSHVGESTAPRPGR